jgi:hypothetical protein
VFGGTRAFERGKAHICTILVYNRALGGCHDVLTLLSYSWHLEIRRVMLGYVVLTTNQIICSCFNNSDELTAIGHRRRHYRMISEWLKWRRKHRQRILYWSLVWHWSWAFIKARSRTWKGLDSNMLIHYFYVILLPLYQSCVVLSIICSYITCWWNFSM